MDRSPRLLAGDDLIRADDPRRRDMECVDRRKSASLRFLQSRSHDFVRIPRPGGNTREELLIKRRLLRATGERRLRQDLEANEITRRECPIRIFQDRDRCIRDLGSTACGRDQDIGINERQHGGQSAWVSPPRSLTSRSISSHPRVCAPAFKISWRRARSAAPRLDGGGPDREGAELRRERAGAVDGGCGLASAGRVEIANTIPAASRNDQPLADPSSSSEGNTTARSMGAARLVVEVFMSRPS